MEIPDNHISCCIGVMQHLQPDHLTRLSTGAGPIVESIINGCFWCSDASKFESLAEKELFTCANMPNPFYDRLFAD